MLTFVDSLAEEYENGLISDVIFLHFAEAFDRVSHKPLLHKLQAYGISGNVLAWIEDFLNTGKFFIQVGTEQSAEATVQYGVP